MKNSTLSYPRIVATNAEPKGKNPGKLLHWQELPKYNGTLSMAGYEHIVLTHSAN